MIESSNIIFISKTRIFAQYSFLKMEIYNLHPYFWKLITCVKTKSAFL